MRPPALENPPPIDPRDHAIESGSWEDGQVRFHLVRHDGRYYAWIAWPGHNLVYPMPSAAAARSFLASEQAFWVLTVPPAECVVHVLVLDPGGSSHIIYRAAVVDSGAEGIWLATGDGTGAEESRALAGFADLAAAVEAFADQLADAARRIERDGLTDYPAVIGAVLRYRAALARADAARATLGGVLRGHQAQIRADRAVTAVACAVGVSREFLHRVLASGEWAWPAPARLTPSTAAPAAGAPPGTPGAAWEVTATFTVETADDCEARGIVTGLLRQMEVPGQITSTTSAPGRSLAVMARFDLSGLQQIVPGDAVTCLRYVVRNLPGMIWRSGWRRGARHEVWKWRRADRTRDEDQLAEVLAAVRTAEIRASLIGLLRRQQPREPNSSDRPIQPCDPQICAGIRTVRISP